MGRGRGNIHACALKVRVVCIVGAHSPLGHQFWWDPAVSGRSRIGGDYRTPVPARPLPTRIEWFDPVETPDVVCSAFQSPARSTNGMGPSAEHAASRPERLIGALVPPSKRRSTPPVPLEVPALPRLARPADARAEALLLDVARLDASGRFCTRSLLTALAWSPGHRVDLRIGVESMVISTCGAGRHAVGSRGELTLPTAARTLAGLAADAQIVLVAVPAWDLLIVDPPVLLVRLLAEH